MVVSCSYDVIIVNLCAMDVIVAWLSQVGLAAAACFVQMMTGVGVEICVAFTGVVGLSGAVGKVGSIEAKLRYADSTPDITVVVVAEGNRDEAERLIQANGWSIQLLPVRHMEEVIRWVFLQPVTQGELGVERDRIAYSVDLDAVGEISQGLTV